MASRSFKARLQACQKGGGGLTTADLRHWFGRPYATVRSWLFFDYEPTGPSGRLANYRLDLLEWAIKNNRGFPVPLDLSHYQRPRHIAGIRNDLERDASVSGVRAAS